MRSKRTKFESIGWYYMMKYFMFILRYPLTKSPETVARYYHSVLSMVPGPKKPFTFAIKDSGGIEDLLVKDLVYFVPGLGRVSCGISAITNGSTI